MRLVRKPSLTRPILRAFNRPKNPLGTRRLSLDSGNGNTPFADTEERSKVAFARRIQDDASAELGVGDPLAGSELRLVCHATASGDPKVEQA
jgi:hypothetical protein